MVRLGVEYGKGLQLINILRDLGGDIASGRCYLPAQELHSLGVTPEELPREGARVHAVVDRWRLRAEQGIAAGVEYSCAIRPWRVRLASALPALIGARTLALLRDAGPEIFDMKIKVQRAEVRRILLKMMTSLASPSAIRAAFKHLSA
jgi:farnesyl-diphosphate farnesyltransferase